MKKLNSTCNKDYNPVLKDLYTRLLDHIAQRDAWNWPEVTYLKLQHQHKAEAILELLESVTVFHVGLGYTTDKSKFTDRVKSFEFLK